MKLLQKKMEEDKRRLEEQFRTDMETQRVLMQDMMTANMNELRSERQATIEQNQILLDTMEVCIIVSKLRACLIDYDAKKLQRKAELAHRPGKKNDWGNEKLLSYVKMRATPKFP